VSRLVLAVRGNEHAVLTVSACDSGISQFDGVSLSLPRVVGARGIVATLWPELSPDETAALGRSADLLRATVKGVGY
jgi:L-lactate dehydrogenase